MAKMNREQLKKLREEKKKLYSFSQPVDKKIKVIVGMGTCGIAAGAKIAMEAFKDEVANRNIENVEICQAGCNGYCAHEPTFEIVMPGMPTVIYGHVDDKIARKIVDRHLVNQRLVNECVLDKPAVDIMK